MLQGVAGFSNQAEAQSPSLSSIKGAAGLCAFLSVRFIAKTGRPRASELKRCGKNNIRKKTERGLPRRLPAADGPLLPVYLRNSSFSMMARYRLTSFFIR